MITHAILCESAKKLDVCQDALDEFIKFDSFDEWWEGAEKCSDLLWVRFIVDIICANRNSKENADKITSNFKNFYSHAKLPLKSITFFIDFCKTVYHCLWCVDRIRNEKTDTLFEKIYVSAWLIKSINHLALLLTLAEDEFVLGVFYENRNKNQDIIQEVRRFFSKPTEEQLQQAVDFTSLF